VIGTCTLASISRAHQRAELGYAIVRSHWRQGYASEVATAMVRFAFNTLDLHRLEADVDPRNIPSTHVLERLGFRKEGYLRERYHMNGEIQDAVLFGLLRHEAPLH
jgi:ribosomal-protein-alanine N-acetyltransferase